jgi:hypothetical protein
VENSKKVVTANYKFLKIGHHHVADTFHAALETSKERTIAEVELTGNWEDLMYYMVP